jgi:hypothetical protein
MRRFTWRAIVANLSVVVAACGYFPESSFELASESRIPRWFGLPQGQQRAAVTVRVDYYSGPFGGTAKLVMRDSTGKTTVAEGQIRNSAPLTRYGKPGREYPKYEIVKVGDIVEVMEHRRMEPTFYITDDPDVWRNLVGRDPH